MPPKTKSLLTLAALLLPLTSYLKPLSANAQPSPPVINIPYFASDINLSQGAISWFGQVTPSLNYADVRAGFNSDMLQLTLHVFDRLLWYNPEVTSSPLTAYDSASLYFRPDPDTIYRIDAQVNHWESRANYQASYKLIDDQWLPFDVNLTTTSGWRGNGFNDLTDDRGWLLTYQIPFSGLNLPTPQPGTHWSIALVVYDRDDAAGTPIQPQLWPSNFNPQTLENMGTLVFNPPSPTPPSALSPQTTIIRHGLNNQTVLDAHIGGHTNCGQNYSPNFFNGWGDANYAGFNQINIQNQWDVADWPCFSKFIITFPLSQIPVSKVIVSAELKLFQFGNAGAPGESQPSLIHVLTTSNNWSESQVTWNNAPPPQENVSSSWVEPLTSSVPWPGAPRTWDVTQAVSQSYRQSTPLSIFLYSSDNAYHSGKYFSSSNTEDWNAQGRPTLTIVWGEPSLTPPGDFNADTYIDFLDKILLISSFNQTNCTYNLLGTCLIDIFDINHWIKNLIGS